MNVIVFPGLTMSTALTGKLLCGEVRSNAHAQGLARTRIALCQRPRAGHGRNRRYDLACGKISGSVLNALSK